MKQIILILSLLIVFTSLSALSLSFSPSQLDVNQISTFSFDPYNPLAQPVLTNVLLVNDNVAQQIEMQVVVKWNNITILAEEQAILKSRMLEANETIPLTNRDLITEQTSNLFNEVRIDFDIMDMVDKFPTLKNAVLSGYFPDGILKMMVYLRPLGSNTWLDPSTFTIRIRNAGGIYLNSPGALIGRRVPVVDHLPVSFIWNAVNTGFNDQKLVIREYLPSNPPRLSTIKSTGVEVYHSQMPENSGFSQYLPLNNGYYYAWMVYSEIYDQDNVHLGRNSGNKPKLESNWFVFRYMMSEGGDASPEDIQIMLNMLGDSTLKSILSLGYTPTGEVIFEGRTYRGQDALDILTELIGKELEVEIKD